MSRSTVKLEWGLFSQGRCSSETGWAAVCCWEVQVTACASLGCFSSWIGWGFLWIPPPHNLLNCLYVSPRVFPYFCLSISRPHPTGEQVSGKLVGGLQTSQGRPTTTFQILHSIKNGSLIKILNNQTSKTKSKQKHNTTHSKSSICEQKNLINASPTKLSKKYYRNIMPTKSVATRDEIIALFWTFRQSDQCILQL